MKLRVLDLFSGIGGFSLGLERTGGFETAAFCEYEEYPRKVLKKHWPSVPCFLDVRELKGSDIDGPIDVICGGFPCQDISVAGQRKGLGNETRSGLWSEIVRLVGDIQPRYVIVENVSNLLSGPDEQRGGWFGRILADLAGCGYDAEWHHIPASAIGSPHHRGRVWIVAYPMRSRRTRLVESKHFGKAGPWRWRGKEDLRALQPYGHGNRWPKPLIRRMDDGVPNRVDRLKCLGNAVVPQVVEMIGYAILEAHNAR